MNLLFIIINICEKRKIALEFNVDLKKLNKFFIRCFYSLLCSVKTNYFKSEIQNREQLIKEDNYEGIIIQ